MENRIMADAKKFLSQNMIHITTNGTFLGCRVRLPDIKNELLQWIYMHRVQKFSLSIWIIKVKMIK